VNPHKDVYCVCAGASDESVAICAHMCSNEGDSPILIDVQISFELSNEFVWHATLSLPPCTASVSIAPVFFKHT
jgi:hypothetical protein